MKGKLSNSAAFSACPTSAGVRCGRAGLTPEQSWSSVEAASSLPLWDCLAGAALGSQLQLLTTGRWTPRSETMNGDTKQGPFCSHRSILVLPSFHPCSPVPSFQALTNRRSGETSPQRTTTPLSPGWLRFCAGTGSWQWAGRRTLSAAVSLRAALAPQQKPHSQLKQFTGNLPRFLRHASAGLGNNV